MKKAIGIITVITAVIITVYFLTICGLRGNESALSTVGLEHHTIFTLWGISTYIALATNISITFLKTKYKFYIILLFLSAIMGINVFLSFFLTKKYLFALISAVILVLDLIMLIIFKETALIEIVPIFAGYIMLTINNLKEGKEKVGVIQ